MYENNQQTTIEHYARDLIAKSVAMIVVLRCYLRKFAPSSAPARKSTKDPDAGLAQEQKQPQAAAATASSEQVPHITKLLAGFTKVCSVRFGGEIQGERATCT